MSLFARAMLYERGGEYYNEEHYVRIYGTIGDLFAWLSMDGLLTLIGVVIVQRKRKTGLATAEQTREAEPLPIPEPVLER